MVALSPFVPRHFKSPLRILCRVFFHSRNRWQQVAEARGAEILRLKAQRDQALRDIRTLQGRLQACQLQAQQVQQPAWHSERPLSGHQHSARMIALCCQLCLLVGFRAIPKVLQCVSDAFGLNLRIPSRDVVRNWNCRNGVAMLQEPNKAPDWIWMIDHSVQLGKMFVLVVLGIRRADFPAGRPLKRQDMSVLAVLPTRTRGKEEVSSQLHEVAAKFGEPMAVVCDGASELREGVASLKDVGFQGVCLSDVKHRIASLLKKQLGSDERWKKFESQLGTTTAAIQQTELEHLLPPRKKQKCRFMNFHRLIDWATGVLALLQQETKSPRLMEKLGWIAEFTADIQHWQQLREMTGVVLRQSNEHGVWVGATEQLRQDLMAMPASTDWAVRMRERLIEIVASNERQLEPLKIEGLRLPCSTEVLESAFGSFKAIQRHHNRGTFTTLLATFPTLFDDCTPAKIRERLLRVRNKDLAEWVEAAGLSDSTQARRMRARPPGS